MVNGIKKWLQKHGYDQNIDSDVAGMVLENHKEEIKIDKDDQELKIFAAMFLNEQDLSMNVIAHESVHAAMDYERLIVRFLGVYDGNDDSGEAPEERLAYTVGEYVEEIVKLCHIYKVKIGDEDKKADK
jgi:hypothetical protein